MSRTRTRLAFAALAGVALLCACGQPESPMPPSSVAAAPSASRTEAAPPPSTTSSTSSPSATSCGTGATIATPKGSRARLAGVRVAASQPCPAISEVSSGDPLADLARGTVDLAIADAADGMAIRETGAPLVHVAQIFQRSPSVEVSLPSSGINSPADFAGHRIGITASSSRYEAIAAAQVAGLDPVADVRFVTTDDIAGLRDGTLDAVQTTTYSGLPEVQSSLGSDVVAISFAEQGVGMLADGIWARGDLLESDAAYRDRVQSAVTAVLRGWITCRDDDAACAAQLAEPTSPEALAAVNALVWPAPQGIGTVDPAAWDLTINVAHNTKDLDGRELLSADVSPDARTSAISSAALATLQAEGLNTTG